MTFTGFRNNNIHFLSLLALSLAWTSGAAQAEVPKTFNATYKAKYAGISVKAKRSLETLENGDQLFRFEADSWIASIEESSRFHWRDGVRIVPREYRYRRKGLGRNRTADLSFDWNNNTVINDVERKPWQMDVPDFALDKLSYQLQLRTDLINAKPLLEYDIADGGRLKQYRFEVLGEEKLDTKVGTFATVKIRRVRDEEDDEERHTVLWMAKNWDYMIVRLQQIDGSKSYEIDLSEATLAGEEVRGLLGQD